MPIFDQGYQHWNGVRSGHLWRWWAITRHGVRAQLRNRFVRLLLVFAYAPAVALIAVLAVWGLLEQQSQSILSLLNRMLPAEMIAQPQDYRVAVWTIAYSFFFKAELFVSMLILLLIGPNLISRDLRFNALPLYFSRPLRRFDYLFGKLGVIGSFLAAVVILPAIFAYVLGVGFSFQLSVIQQTYQLLGASILYGLIIGVSAGTFMLALSSLSRRSIYVGLAWMGFWIVTTTVAGLLTVIHRETIFSQFREEAMAAWRKENPPPKGSFQEHRAEWEKYHGGQFQVYTKAQARGEAAWAEVAVRDWRPIISYTSNLDRLADLLLATDAAWVTIGRQVDRPRRMVGPMMKLGMNPRESGRIADFFEQPVNERRLANQIVPQYPWYWSASILVVLLVLSLWVLTFRIQSLDRLK
jgi:ABC-type transport system involved in multi-copper enzyme maturation permease subunit